MHSINQVDKTIHAPSLFVIVNAARCPPRQRLWLDCKQQSWSSGDLGMDSVVGLIDVMGRSCVGIPEARARRCIGLALSHGAKSQWRCLLGQWMSWA